MRESRPVVVFECHKDSQDFGFFRDFFDVLDYTVMEINEQAGALPDARNFIAFDSQRGAPPLESIQAIVEVALRPLGIGHSDYLLKL